MAESSVRQRAPAKSNGAPKPALSKKTPKPKSTSSGFGIVDSLRVVAGLSLASTLGSYYASSGTSLSWGLFDGPGTPRSLPLTAAQLRHYLWPPAAVELTNDELAGYDGSDADRPIYVAINRTIYDVSAARQVYGPAGAYSTLAAKDASRSYITTCFDPVEDLVPYLGGVEEVYVPLWLSKKPFKGELAETSLNPANPDQDAEFMIDQIHQRIGRRHVRALQRDAYEDARARVRDTISMWEGMFAKKGYPVAGRVVGVDDDDPLKWRHLGFCDAARKLRPPMDASFAKALAKIGRGDNMDLSKAAGAFGAAAAEKKRAEAEAAEEAEAGGASDTANVRIEDVLPGGKYAGKGGKAAPGKAAAAGDAHGHRGNPHAHGGDPHAHGGHAHGDGASPHAHGAHAHGGDPHAHGGAHTHGAVPEAVPEAVL